MITRDCFGRVICTHQCPECGARFLSAAMCRGAGDGPGRRAHDEEIQTLAILGCTPPPNRRWAIALPITVCAPTEAKAFELSKLTVADYFPAKVVERYGDRLSPIALEGVEEAAGRGRADAARQAQKDAAW